MKGLAILHLRQRNYTVNIKETEVRLRNGNFPVHFADYTSRLMHNMFSVIQIIVTTYKLSS